jgi:hypothetical protein
MEVDTTENATELPVEDKRTNAIDPVEQLGHRLARHRIDSRG